MSLHRFLAYIVLACWIAVTAVMVGTALQWSAARAGSEIKIGRARDAQKVASASSEGNAQLYPTDTPEEREAAAEMQRRQDRLALKAETASDDMADAIQLEQIEQKRFWVEFGVWGGLSLLASALLAERRDSEERPAARK